MRILKCHCGKVEAEINIQGDLKKTLRCNCSLCKRRGSIMSMVENKNFKIIKGNDYLKLYQFYTKVAKHYFCKNCGIYTHHRSYTNPENYEFNVACIDNVDTFEYKDIPVFDGEKL